MKKRNGKTTKPTLNVNFSFDINVIYLENLDVLLDPLAASGQVGQWEEVAVEEDYYAQNALDPILLREPGEEEEQIDMKEVELEEKLDKLEELDEEQIEELLNLDKAEHGKSVLRSKTDKLKKLIDADVEQVFKPTFKKVKRNF